MTTQIFLDLIGLYYCVEKCGNKGTTSPIFREVLRRMATTRKFKIVKVWDKLTDLGEEIERFIDELPLALTRGINLNAVELDECRESSARCPFINCIIHKAYCCMCGRLRETC